MTPRHLLLAGGVVVAGWLAFFGDKTPANDIAEPVAPRRATPAKTAQVPLRVANSAAKTAASVLDILALRPREELIGGTHAEESATLFAAQSWTPPPPPPPKPAPPPPPTAPPLPFVYLGKKTEDGTWEVYLARGEQTYIVREKSFIDGEYRVESIKPPTLSVTYMPLNELQTLAIGGAE
jgi:hypothetical protein